MTILTNQIYRSGALVLATLLLACRFGSAEQPEDRRGLAVHQAFSSSLDGSTSAESGFVRVVPSQRPDKRTFRPFTAIGLSWRGGIGGLGLDLSTPLARKFNLRVGGDYFHYEFSFQEEGANIDATVHMRSAHASVDWFPLGGRFRVSPMLLFANGNRMHANVLIPPGRALSMNGQDYYSSTAEPLHGSGTITFRKTSPGLTFGFGNLIPRTRSHISIPVEAGFYYVNQPRLDVDFAGKGCDPNYPEDIGCGYVMDDEGFRHDLNAFIARNNHNLSYVSFFPVLSIGFGYSF